MASVTASIDENRRRSQRVTGRGEHRVAVVGAGVAGLAAAIQLASQGASVTLFERGPHPGGKIRQVEVAGHAVDAGPTVLTMRWVFERLFEEAGSQLDDFVETHRAEVLCRHAWQDGSRLDLFADRERSIEAIGQFAGAQEALGYRRFAETSERLYRVLEPTFIDASKPSAIVLAGRMGRVDPASLLLTNPAGSLWRTLQNYFADPRLQQLFGRYATYSGASPFQASATLMLIAHVEEAGVWTVRGGMIELARALERLARSLGVGMNYRSGVKSLELSGGRIGGLRLDTGEMHGADAIVLTADCEALTEGLFGSCFKTAVRRNTSGRSLSAIATALACKPEGWPLTRHNVCFSNDYQAEFDDIFKRGRLPREPTVYICAQDRPGHPETGANPDSNSLERALLLVNAPADGDRHQYKATEIDRCWDRTLAVLQRCGLTLAASGPTRHTTTPNNFHDLFPATGGALYGRSSHGWTAAFQRPGNRTTIPGLYLAGGSVHPGAGVPMAALSGRQAAANLLADRASIRRYHPAAISGGTSTR
ncbi:MAG: phytoene desaturase [Alphaproteobacteria bacterium]|nr:phytoene desaturase [Alphaproteobacteria bacterium]